MAFSSELLARLALAICKCERCPLVQGRTQAVPGEGAPDARVMLIGEGPGAQEDESGRPFVGAAGQLLDKLLARAGLRREEVFITNVVKCRPPGNRDPQPVETEMCKPFLKRQIELIRPKVVCQLGRIAGAVMMGHPIQISKVHGQRFIGPGYFNVPVYHPAAALRTPSTLGTLQEDFEKLKVYLTEEESPPDPPAPEPEQMGLF